MQADKAKLEIIPHLVTVYVLLTFVFVCTIVVRLYLFRDGVWPINYDAPYHVLLTIDAWKSVAISEHHFLPIVSYNGPLDRFIPWGNVPISAEGTGYYLSFPFLGFFTAYLFQNIAGIEPSLQSLMVLNFLIHAACTILLVNVAAKLSAMIGASASRQALCAFLAGLTYLLGRETLMAHGPTYWSHSPYQMIFLAQILVFLKIAKDSRPQAFHVISLVVLSFAGPLTEWTGYLTNFGIAIALFYLQFAQGKATLVAGILILLVTSMAGLTFLGHVLSLFSLEQLRSYLVDRAVRSSGADRSLFEIINNSFQSTVLMLPLGLTAGIVIFRKKIGTSAWAVLFVATVPSLENALLLGHSSDYHFDRAKLFVPLALAVVAWLSTNKRAVHLSLAWTIAIASNASLFLYSPRAIHVAEGVAMDVAAWEKVKHLDLQSTVFTTSGIVRGYRNIIAHRSIYETVPTPEAMAEITKKRGGKIGIWLTSSVAPSGWWDTIYLYDATTGNVKKL